MRKFNLLNSILIFVCILGFACYAGVKNYRKKMHACDVAIMGPLLFADGIGRQSIGLIETLKDTYSIQAIRTGAFSVDDLSDDVLKIADLKYRTPANVLIYEAPLFRSAPKLPKSKIKIAYSMLESTKIPTSWVRILNRFFDAVAVPDKYLVDVYKQSGVKIPIFEVPLGIYIEPFLQKNSQRQKKENKPFVFGNLGMIDGRKNQLKILEAFIKVFKDNPNVHLVLNGREHCTDNSYLIQLKKMLAFEEVKNVYLTSLSLSWDEYIDKFSEFDCYVNASKGEGFSIQPREAIAMGIPAIVTDNTAQTTICETGYVRSLACPLAIPAQYRQYKGEDLGQQFDCTVDDLAAAMKDVYDNYAMYAQKAAAGRPWVEGYEHKNLKQYYETLVLPKKVVLAETNEIRDGVLYTNSKDLQKKYEELMDEQTVFRKFTNSLVKFVYQ
jgi:glycosyltransferase involved in cell wall biosynthesis